MPSILQGGPRPAPAMPAAAPMHAGAMPEHDDGKQLVASIYEKPDGTYCTEGPDGTITEFPDMEAALDSVKDSSGMDMEPEPDATGAGKSSDTKDYD